MIEHTVEYLEPKEPLRVSVPLETLQRIDSLLQDIERPKVPYSEDQLTIATTAIRQSMDAASGIRIFLKPLLDR